MTDAIWPETLTLIEYISRKFWLSSARPIWLTTRAAHRERRNACRADHRVDLFALGQEQIQQLGEENAAGGVKNKRDQAQRQDQQRVGLHELVGGHLRRPRSGPARS